MKKGSGINWKNSESSNTSDAFIVTMHSACKIKCRALSQGLSARLELVRRISTSVQQFDIENCNLISKNAIHKSIENFV